MKNSILLLNWSLNWSPNWISCKRPTLVGHLPNQTLSKSQSLHCFPHPLQTIPSKLDFLKVCIASPTPTKLDFLKVCIYSFPHIIIITTTLTCDLIFFSSVVLDCQKNLACFLVLLHLDLWFLFLEDDDGGFLIDKTKNEQKYFEHSLLQTIHVIF